VTQKTQATQKTTQKTQATQPSTPASSNEKINKVISYAKSNVGGAYVWGGARYRATDCSGLTMLSYAQVGISLPHYAQSQAACGRAVSFNQMQPGDLITFGSAYNVYHVAMYIGNGLMVHAENSNTGIVISNVSSFSRYNPIYNIRRIIG
jgi:cell wall-associated NlpC family hydrolase